MSDTKTRAGAGRAAAAPKPARDRRLLGGRYRLERRVGTGGSADVWRAHDERLDRTVAVKRLHAALLPDEAARERFATEARAAAGLTHPGILPVLDVVDEGRSLAIVMGFLDGPTLADRLRDGGTIPEPQARSIVAQLADALGAAHRAGVVHLDVKPGNVLLDEASRPRLVDFGIARLVEEAERRSGQASRSEVLGTLRYMAPEQLTGGPVDGRTDLYALGLLLVEMLTGHQAFDGATPRDILESRLQRAPDLSGVPSDLVPLLRRLLDPDPSARPSSAEEVRDALAPDLAAARPAASAGEDASDERWAVTRTVSVAPMTAAFPVPDAQPAAVVTPAATKRRARPGSRPSPRTVGLLLAGALALVAAVALLGDAVSGSFGGVPGGIPAVAAPSETPAPTATRPPADTGGGGGGGGSNKGGNGNGRGGGRGHD